MEQAGNSNAQGTTYRTGSKMQYGWILGKPGTLPVQATSSQQLSSD
jgi:hypothetical protein